SHTAVWTGRAMLIWGGLSSPPFITFAGGGAYDPSTDTWTPISEVGAPSPRLGASAIWTGQRMVIWGGTDSAPRADGGRYDPATDTWIPIWITGAPAARSGHTAVWGAGLMLIWGGGFQNGGRYDPVADLWLPMSTSNAPTGIEGNSAVWTGD